MSFNNSYGEEPGKGRASWAVPGAATALPALLQAALSTPPSRSSGRCVRAGQDGGEVRAGWEVRLLGQGPVPPGWRPGASSLRAPSPAQRAQ